ncbi:hypothetical protein B0H13DRAFT_2327492 [Mycena leptocephala]|nr:hypothetical protein B0H13DRAFT_2327492 [Mycena leptocephala]
MALLALEVTGDSSRLGSTTNARHAAPGFVGVGVPRQVAEGSSLDADVTERARLIPSRSLAQDRGMRLCRESSAEQRRAREGLHGGDTPSRSSTEMSRELRARRCGLGSHHRRCATLSNEDTIRSLLPSSRDYPIPVNRSSAERMRMSPPQRELAGPRGMGCIVGARRMRWARSSSTRPAGVQTRARNASCSRSLAPLIDGTFRVPSLQGAATLWRGGARGSYGESPGLADTMVCAVGNGLTGTDHGL